MIEFPQAAGVHRRVILRLTQVEVVEQLVAERRKRAVNTRVQDHALRLRESARGGR
jgi:hypothetical protein